MTVSLPPRTADIKPEDLPEVKRFPFGTPVRELVKALTVAGGVIVEGMHSPELMKELEAEIRPLISNDSDWDGGFFPTETRRCSVLVGKSRIAAQVTLGDDLLWELSDAFLAEVNWYWYGDMKQWGKSSPQLNTCIAFSVNPCKEDQPLHRDDHCHHNNLKEIDTYPEDLQERETLLGYFFAVKKTTKENGATRFIPGSHLWGKDREPSDHLAYYAEMNPGDGFFMLGSCYHGGSKNTTKDEERLVVGVFTTKGYYRQEENQYLGVPMEMAKSFPTKWQKRLGYAISEPWCGHVDSADPILFLDPSLDDGNKDLFSKEALTPYRL
ncbi:unnamed protein product [Kuraishia capsulata CBS 1993]|uniref:Phytanoyl-CoA dioxygenase family protein n=1 Tax=Kuraishia capsulata CBS 1993 TaxID=1382522 RepID=W6MJS2_9ASCO|nr:uncharacterized protein KUCA_T00002758001 [Kuraishia capsulata CBS 1993]CDK26784.1 unnamed protein product [Kuraishia capsulata CBS 1993]